MDHALGVEALHLEIMKKRDELVENGHLSNEPMEILDLGAGMGYGLLSLAYLIAKVNIQINPWEV